MINKQVKFLESRIRNHEEIIIKIKKLSSTAF
jgi:hypothetical protein